MVLYISMHSSRSTQLSLEVMDKVILELVEAHGTRPLSQDPTAAMQSPNHGVQPYHLRAVLRGFHS